MSEPEGTRIVGVCVCAPETTWLTDAMVAAGGAAIPRGELADPRAAPEIVFLLGSRLAGPGVTAATALAAVDAVSCGIQVSGDGSTTWFATGPVAVPPAGLDLTLEACLVEVDGQVVDSATGAAVLGHPAEALALAANELGRRGRALEPGWIVFTGGLTDAVACPAGTAVAAHFTSLGSVFLPR